MNFLDVFKGMLLGIANIIPGVSGGTMAVVLGIYEKLIDSINSLKSDFKNSFVYLLKIAIGVLIGVFLFSGVISFFLGKYPIETNYLFVGLVIGSFNMISEKINNKKISIRAIIGCILGFVFVCSISYLGETIGISNSIELSGGISTILILIFSGFVAAAAMILPGVSGSLILVMLGLYDRLVLAVLNMEVLILIPVALGVLLGVLSMSKVISYLIKKYNDDSYRFIIGLVIGSIALIIKDNPLNGGFLYPFIFYTLGCLITITLGRYGKPRSRSNTLSCHGEM